MSPVSRAAGSCACRRRHRCLQSNESSSVAAQRRVRIDTNDRAILRELSKAHGVPTIEGVFCLYAFGC
ncbi:hypothetical protein BVIET440_20231 [Burkholderia vietnamiensis]